MFSKMFTQPADGDGCPFLRGACWKRKCRMWTHVRGKDPQSGAALDLEDCSLKWLPVLMIENAQEVRQTAAAVESARNEQSRNLDRFMRLVPGRLLIGDGK